MTILVKLMFLKINTKYSDCDQQFSKPSGRSLPSVHDEKLETGAYERMRRDARQDSGENWEKNGIFPKYA